MLMQKCGGNGGCGIDNRTFLIGRSIVDSLYTILLSTHQHVWMPFFASLDALVPRVLECCVASCPAVSEPRTATSAATQFAGFRDGATCEAYGTYGRRRST